MSEMPIVIFADGAAKGNPGPGGWGVIVVTPGGEVMELAGRVPHTTNNRMELTAVIEGLGGVRTMPGRVAVYTDSTYVIRGIREWIHAWRRRGWKTAGGTDVLNRDLWEELSALIGSRARGSVDWRWVRGHVGTPGNERCDEIAVAFAAQRPADLYDGPLSGYDRPILEVPADTALPERRASSSTPKTAAYS